ncbi:MAG: hypothetical protein AAF721_02240 [Myxococcota bacterium]
MSGQSQPKVSRRPPRLDAGGYIELSLWAAAWVVAPFYVVPRGLPQIYDWTLVALFAGMVAAGRLMLVDRARGPLSALGMFIGYAMLVGCAWAAITGAWAFLVPALYYAFNLAVVLTALSLHHRWQGAFLRVTLWSWAISLVVQAILVTVMPAGYHGVRGLAFFNNPNQLAIFGVAGAVLVVQLARKIKVSAAVEYGLLIACGVLVVSSASRAGVLAYVALAATRFLSRPGTIVATTVVAVLLALYFPWELLPIDFVEDRMRSSVAESTSSLARERGYARMIEYPEYMLLGAGEGLEERFGQRIEIHSTPGTLLFCYGVAGAGFFVAACFAVYRRAGSAETLLLLPLLVLSLFHHTLRVRFFWLNLAVALMSAVGAARARPRRARRGDGVPGG